MLTEDKELRVVALRSAIDFSAKDEKTILDIMKDAKIIYEFLAETPKTNE